MRRNFEEWAGNGKKESNVEGNRRRGGSGGVMKTKEKDGFMTKFFDLAGTTIERKARNLGVCQERQEPFS